MNNHRKIILYGVAGLALMMTIFAFFMIIPDNDQSNIEGSNQNQTPQSIQRAEQAKLTQVEVASHSSAEDCWTIINGGVYDLTSYLKLHPGGEEILRACGNDATTLFTTRKTDQNQPIGSGTPHSSSAEQQLEKLKIGDLES